jgi:DNA-binding transcriptional LysR family regulator
LISFAVTGTIDDVSLSQIRYFVAVAEEGNVGRAAQRLHVAQPPVSRHIRALEDEIGAPLFERTPRGMSLLPPGRVFLDHARAILAAVDRAVVATRAETEPPPRAAAASTSSR